MLSFLRDTLTVLAAINLAAACGFAVIFGGLAIVWPIVAFATFFVCLAEQVLDAGTDYQP